jgi:hypothetical protein
VPIRSGTPSETEDWSEDLGCGNVDRKWGIALRTVSGDSNDLDQEKVEK